MKCPQCGSWTEVLYTRPQPNGRIRRLVCANNHRFWTLENIVPGPFSSATKKAAALKSIEEQRKRLINKLKK